MMSQSRRGWRDGLTRASGNEGMFLLGGWTAASGVAHDGDVVEVAGRRFCEVGVKGRREGVGGGIRVFVGPFGLGRWESMLFGGTMR